MLLGSATRRGRGPYASLMNAPSEVGHPRTFLVLLFIFSKYSSRFASPAVSNLVPLVRSPRIRALKRHRSSLIGRDRRHINRWAPQSGQRVGDERRTLVPYLRQLRSKLAGAVLFSVCLWAACHILPSAWAVHPQRYGFVEDPPSWDRRETSRRFLLSTCDVVG